MNYELDFAYIPTWITLLDSVTLPNGTSYSFEYDHEIENFHGYITDYGTRA